MKKTLTTLFIGILTHFVIGQNVWINNTDPISAPEVNDGIRLRIVTTIKSGSCVLLDSLKGYNFYLANLQAIFQFY